MSSPSLVISGLRVGFRTPHGMVEALRGVDLQIDHGRTVCLIGESGSGKSVTGRTILGLLPKHSARIRGGSVLFEGRELLDLSEREFRALRGRRIATVFQDPTRALNPTRRIGDQVGEPLRIHFPKLGRTEVRSKVVDTLEAVRLPDAVNIIRRYPHELSGGMRQRVAIAMALVADPAILIADEPTTALDVTTQIQILDLLSELQRERKMSVLLITHDMGVAAHYADDVAVMYAGRIVERAPANELFTDVEMPYTDGLLNSLPSTRGARGDLQAIPGGPPDLSLPIVGCAFAPRCKYATDKCRVEAPNTTTVSAQHAFECWHPVGLSSKEAVGGR